ncbi:unnamed protein product [Paramecium primaurelia]|uniref:EF-hand domain-containing protein n=1 Tax=Paramecium primaurelia TaxID=5886 RepID=A0A8S1MNL4_PARPR|nr:unnamed protein product [Paramecium primaurelia]
MSQNEENDKISEESEQKDNSSEDEAEERENQQREEHFGRDEHDAVKVHKSPTQVKRQVLKRKSTMKAEDMFGMNFFKFQYYVNQEDLGIRKKPYNSQSGDRLVEHNFYMHEKKYSFGKNSLYILNESNIIRKYCVWIVTWHWFDKIITLIIVLNTISLAMQNYDFRVNGTSNQSELTYVRNQMEYFFTAVFLLEFILKILAMGFLFERHTYLRDGWNVLDFAVVGTSILSLVGSFNLSAIRTIRILRPLRSIKSVPGLRILVASLLDSLPNLGNVLVFLLYLLVIFGILGLQLFAGAYENRCRFTQFPVNGTWPADPLITHLCSSDSDCPENEYCGNPINYNLPNQDIPIPELNYSYTTFDNILTATFTIFQALTTEGWSTIVTQLIDAVNPILVYIYFNLLIIIGSFFTINLILAVINDSFLKNQSERRQELLKEEQQRKQQRKEKKQKERQNAQIHPTQNIADLVPSDDSDSDEEAQKKKEEIIKQVLKPSKFQGRAEQLKILQDQFNRKVKKEKQQINFFDPSLYTLDVNDDKGTNFDTKFKQFFLRFIESLFFTILVNFIIAANTVVLAMDRYPQPKSEIIILSYLNLAFTLFFVIEMILKFFALGITEYFKDYMNIFDAIIVAISLVEQVLDLAEISVSGGSITAVSAFRTLRVFRIFKLARSWNSLREILIAIATTLEAISFFTMLLLLFMVIASLVGMELFAYNIPDVRLNFNTFFDAMITIFALLTSESWNIQTYLYMYKSDQWWPLIFFISVVIMGNLILLKLFIAILIYNFGQKSIETEKKLQDKMRKLNFQQLVEQFRSSIKVFDPEEKIKHKSPKPEEVHPEHQKKLKINQNYIGQHQNSDVACFFLAKYDQARFEVRKETKQKKLIKRFFDTAEIVDPEEISDDSSGDEEYIKQMEQKMQFQSQGPLTFQDGYTPQISLHQSSQQPDKKSSVFSKHETSSAQDHLEGVLIVGTSLFIFDQQSKIRRFAFRFINKSQVVGFIILMILVSSVLLALDDPLEESNSEVLTEIDLVVTIIFTAESLLKILAYGFLVNGEFSYMRDYANVLDFIVIIFSWVSIFSDANLQIFKILRIFRVLRPLRLVSRSDSLKIAINALILSLSKIFNLILVSLVFYGMFGIFGTNFFKGAFYSCDISKVGEYQIIGKYDCFDYGGNWVNADYNFDNALNSISSLFVISTTEGWLEQMYQGIDSVGIDLQPIHNYNMYWSLFYIGFVIIGSFFVMNLFAGVVLDAFNSETDKLRGYFYMTLEQQEWVDIKERIYYAKPQINQRMSDQWFRAKMFQIINHKYFDSMIFFLITINTILFMLQFVRQPDILDIIISYSNLGFLCIFTTEMLIKLIALGWQYFAEPFNRFDFVVVILSIAGSVLEQMSILTAFGTVISVFRSFRIVRIMRLIRSARSLKAIFETFFLTVSQLANIGGLLSIILFMFAVLGINLFPYVKWSNNGLTDSINFSTLGKAFFTLFKCSTGEQWDQVQADLVRQMTPNNVCFSENLLIDYQLHGFNGCGFWYGVAYMVSFQMIFAMIMLNLFVAIIVQGYEIIQKDEASSISTNHIQAFIEVWKFYDQTGSGLIRALDLDRFMVKLPKPLGWKGLLLTQMEKRKFINQYRLPVYIKNQTAMYFFYDVLEILSHNILTRKYGDDTELEPKKLVKATKDLIKKRLQLIEQLKNAKTCAWTSEDINSAFIIMRRMKWKLDELKEKRKNEVHVLRDLSSGAHSSEQDNSPDQTQRPSQFNTQGLTSGHQMHIDI